VSEDKVLEHEYLDFFEKLNRVSFYVSGFC